MEYDQGYWSDYAGDNEDRYNGEFAAFVRDLVSSLRCGSVLEIGCSTGIDLRLMGEQVRVFGADLNEGALEVARAKMPRGDFRVCDIARLPFGDSSMDFVFTHQLLNYLDDRTLEAGMAEMLRVAGRYIMSCEMYGTDGGVIDGGLPVPGHVPAVAGPQGADHQQRRDAPGHRAGQGKIRPDQGFVIAIIRGILTAHTPVLITNQRHSIGFGGDWW